MADGPGGALARAASSSASLPRGALARRQGGVHHYNMCSAACGDGVRAHTRDVIAWRVAQHRPVALSLVEACYDDRVQLAGRWPAGFGAGTSYVARESATSCPGAVKRFGNDVFVAGSPRTPGMWAQLPTQLSRSCDRRVGECRGVACARAERAGQHLAVCTAHLEPRRDDPSVTEAQVREYRRVVTEWSRRGGPVVAAGDFNLPRQLVDRWFTDGGLAASPTGSTMVGRDSASDEIDVVYVERSASWPEPTSDRYCDRQASDHCYLLVGGSSFGGRRDHPEE